MNPLSQLDFEDGSLNFNIAPGSVAPISGVTDINVQNTTDPNDYSTKAINFGPSSPSFLDYDMSDGNFPGAEMWTFPFSIYMANVGSQQPGAYNSFYFKSKDGSNQQGFEVNMDGDNGRVGWTTEFWGSSSTQWESTPNNSGNGSFSNFNNAQLLLTFDPTLASDHLKLYCSKAPDPSVPVLKRSLLNRLEEVTANILGLSFQVDRLGNKIEDFRIYDFVVDSSKFITGVTDYHTPPVAEEEVSNSPIAQQIDVPVTMDIRPEISIARGDVVVVGDMVGIPKRDIAAGELGALALKGIFEFPKPTGGGSAIGSGQRLYWNPITKQVNEIYQAGESYLGKAIRQVSQSDTHVQVRINDE